ncbi:hypothetical protein MK904_00355 [Loigolactobacillus coryniformis]|jgi:hypothetical protein|uniref:hypothetical protein n=1 Tax=Loigolactobacillus coryniformis TaxID=1610 RepID=UPI002340FE6D|nr:hypothetical protein [Loigolactobacillus coryniformis]MDC4184547.1 hypothetical protein [Loigolactobacillus coryniformis]
MTDAQKVFRRYLLSNMDMVDQDIERAIIRMRNKWQTAPPELVHAMRQLTAKEKNQVVCEILLPF